MCVCADGRHEGRRYTSCTHSITIAWQAPTTNTAPTLHRLPQVLHGDISQHQRDLTINQFRNKQFQVLVATDVAARGIDVSDIDLVVQYRPPRDSGEHTGAPSSFSQSVLRVKYLRSTIVCFLSCGHVTQLPRLLFTQL